MTHPRTFADARALLLLAAVSASAAFATQLVGLDIAGLTNASDAIVQGTVRRVESRWTSDHRLIVTEIDIAVAESLKGSFENGSNTVTVLQPGGVVGEIGQVVSGLARFSVGDEVLVFLEKQGATRFGVVGMAQGKFRIERTTDQKDAFAIPDDLGSAELIDRTTGLAMQSPLRPTELSELKRQILAAARASQLRKGGR